MCYNIFKGWIDPVTKEKIVFVNKQTDLLNYVDRDQLLVEYGGNQHYQQTYNESDGAIFRRKIEMYQKMMNNESIEERDQSEEIGKANQQTSSQKKEKTVKPFKKAKPALKLSSTKRSTSTLNIDLADADHKHRNSAQAGDQFQSQPISFIGDRSNSNDQTLQSQLNHPSQQVDLMHRKQGIIMSHQSSHNKPHSLFVVTGSIFCILFAAFLLEVLKHEG